jgi:hypothetical protein
VLNGADKVFNRLLEVAILVGAVLFCALFAALLGSSAGEIAQALGGIVGALIGGSLAAFAAYTGVKTTIEGQEATEARRLSDEVKGIRRALHTEVGMIGLQCLYECRAWNKYVGSIYDKELRTAKLPPLTIYNSVSPRTGLLAREEIVPLIGLSGTLHDINMVIQAAEIKVYYDSAKPITSQNERKTLALLFANACVQAANFLTSVTGIPLTEEDDRFIKALRSAHIPSADFTDDAHSR